MDEQQRKEFETWWKEVWCNGEDRWNYAYSVALNAWAAAFEAGRQQGMTQERALWELSASGQEIEKAVPAIPNGWRLVPEEPTEEMRKAGGHVNSEWLNDNAPIGEVRYVMPMQGVWKAMLEAAPIYTPPAEEQP